MAASTQDNDDEIISAINMTPLVDVTLVLLIIFMVTASYIVANSIPVDLPEAATGEEVASTVVVSIDDEGQFHLDGQSIEDERLLASLTQAKQANNELRAIISADRRIRHARFVHAVDIVRRAGISRFAIDIQQRPNESAEGSDEVASRVP
jgi:biopolymer transport protein ExbD